MTQTHGTIRSRLASLILATAWLGPIILSTADAAEVPPAPGRLAETGLYSDFSTLTVDPRNLKFSPQYPLWSDGAEKQRWIYLPPGLPIDGRRPDDWVFPVGTRIWKQFSWSRKVETRYLEKVDDTRWKFATYVWNADGTDAVLAPKEGVKNAYELAPGKSHDIPGVADCRACHEGARIQVLGFGALQLSDDRDPGAPHADHPDPDSLTIKELVRRGLIANLPPAVQEASPRILARTARGRAALGYLHANCSGCHNATDPALGPIGMFLNHSSAATAPEQEPAWLTAVGRKSGFQIPGAAPGASYRIRPGDPSLSAIVYRMSSRNPMKQMPPLGTKLVDEQGLELIRDWIAQDLGTPY